MDFIKIPSENPEESLSLTKKEFDNKLANQRINLAAKKQGLEEYKNSQKTGELFINTQTPLERLSTENNFLKVIKIFENNTLSADPVFIENTLKAVARTLPLFIKSIGQVKNSGDASLDQK